MHPGGISFTGQWSGQALYLPHGELRGSSGGDKKVAYPLPQPGKNPRSIQNNQ